MSTRDDTQSHLDDRPLHDERRWDEAWPALGRQPGERTAAAFSGPDRRWYRSGDLARRDADGRFWCVGRGDDVIETAGHPIGSFEVENVLDGHESVSESGVIGVPDPVAGTVAGASVAPSTGVQPDDDLRRDLIAHCRRQLGSAVTPRTIRFVDELAHTRSGKILRRVLTERAAAEVADDQTEVEA